MLSPQTRSALRSGTGAALMLALVAGGCSQQDQTDQDLSAQATRNQVDRSGKSDMLERFAKLPTPAEDAVPAPSPVPRVPLKATEESGGMARFDAALAALEDGSRREPVTILHLGDSHIASDRFTSDLRRMLQARFGDAGRGLLMAGFPFAYYRAEGVDFAKGGAWAAANSLYDDAGPYGVTGTRLTTDDSGAWLRLTSETGAFEWADVTFVVGPHRGKAVVSVNDIETEVDTRSATKTVKTVRLQRKGTRLTVRSEGGGLVTLLSWGVGLDRPGIRYVNLGIPGATADITARWSDAIVEAAVERIDPSLIVMGYGTNEGFNDNLDIDAYTARYEALLGKLRRYAPEASLLIIGPPDGARFPVFAREGLNYRDLLKAPCRPLDDAEAADYRHLTEIHDARLARWHEPPKLDDVRDALAKTARKTGAEFWDWSSMMGQDCGIHAWAYADPPLAVSDHVHITAEGSRRSAEALFAKLMTGYAAHSNLASR